MVDIWIAIAVLGVISLIFGGLLGYASQKFKEDKDPIVNQIDSLLPQSQCAQCGYPGCLPYADAVGTKGEAINKCVPGGEATMLKIAAVLNIDPQEVNQKDAHKTVRRVAFVDESRCIGCTKCILSCPVDAIIGARKTMHTVVSDICTGCELCISPCPTNCITMKNLNEDKQSIKFISTIPIKELRP
jgi:electron transport complex protein RnfB